MNPERGMGSFGLYDPNRDSGRQRNTLGAGCLVSLGILFAFVVAEMVVLDLGLAVAVVSGIVSFVPAIFYLTAFLWLDRYDPEPFRPLAFAFAFGALFSVFISAIVNGIFGLLAGETLTSIVSAPIVEEGTKGVGVLLVALLFREEFDSAIDGIVYAGVVALGFATVENVLYYGRALVGGGPGEMLATFIARGIFSPFSHVLFTAMTGLGLGIMRETHNRDLKVVAPIAGYVAAVFLHALWNGAASFAGTGFVAFYALIEVPLFFTFLGFVLWLIRRERQILSRALEGEVARGLITAEQLSLVTSMPRRSWWLFEALGTPARLRARRRFLRAVAKLGLCRWHVARAEEAGRETRSFSLIAQLQAEIFALRSQLG